MFLGQNADEVRAEQKKATRDRIGIEVLVWVMGNPGHTREQILDAVRGDVTTKRQVFNELVDDGQFLRSGAGQKNDPHVYQVSEASDVTSAKAA